MFAGESVEYQCTVRGYHVYKSVWEPKESEVLSCFHEMSHIYDIISIKACLTDKRGKE